MTAANEQAVATSKCQSEMIRFSLLFEHDLFRKPASDFRDHALARD
jgi:hypothetical protein